MVYYRPNTHNLDKYSHTYRTFSFHINCLKIGKTSERATVMTFHIFVQHSKNKCLGKTLNARKQVEG